MTQKKSGFSQLRENLLNINLDPLFLSYDDAVTQDWLFHWTEQIWKLLPNAVFSENQYRKTAPFLFERLSN